MTDIVIVTYNSAAVLASCLEALERCPDVRVFVVDNASGDGSAAVAQGFPWAATIANARNLGFAGGCNLGARLGDSPYILLLNPDTVLLTPDLRPMEKACEEHGLASGLLLGQDENAQEGFWARRLPTPAALIFEVLGLNRLWPQNRINRWFRCLDLDPRRGAMVEQPPGAFLMARRDAWEILGGMDERFYPVWFEDTDFCRRAADAGFRVSYRPEVKARHQGGHSVLGVDETVRGQLWYGSLLRYSAKHFTSFTFSVICLAVIAGAAGRAFAVCLRNVLRPASWASAFRMYHGIAWLAAASLLKGNVALTQRQSQPVPVAGGSRH